jgi:hypothetical protein
VIYIDWRASLRAVKAETFRNRILMPAITWLEEHNLNAQVDYIVYSSDFPPRIELQKFFPPDKQPSRLNSAGSLTGLTYLAPYVLSRDPALTASNINWYVPGPRVENLSRCQQLANVPSRGFRAHYLWNEAGKRISDVKLGQRYLLSTMLGVTYGRGNSVEEILSYLRRAVAADGTYPKGTIYFMKNGDKRSDPRDACFDGMAAEINKLGVRALVKQGTIPEGAPDVMGLMAGVRMFDWKAPRSVILKGAICEHFTSFGGDMAPDAFQTPLSEFLRYGAAGASGTVKEPGAFQFKFPLPSLQLHYVRGSSLAEAFYQSVAGPFQLLIVGDPLCQPWARIPSVTASGITPGQEVRGVVAVTPNGPALHTIDVFVDGKLTARMAPRKSLNLDTTKLADGYHELRVVGIANHPLETQGRFVVPFMVNNHGAKLELKIAPNTTIDAAATLRVSVRQPGATSIAIRQNSRVVADVKGEAGEVQIAAATLGRGPTTLQAFSKGKVAVISVPLRITVN